MSDPDPICGRTESAVTPALLCLSSRVLLPRMLAEVKSQSRDDDGETSGERARHLATLRKRKQRAQNKTEAKRPKSAESQDQRCVHLLANNCCSFSLEKQKSPPREFSPLEKDAPPYLDRRILMHAQLFLLSFCRILNTRYQTTPIECSCARLTLRMRISSKINIGIV